MNLTLLAGDFAICQLAPVNAGPAWWRTPGALSLRSLHRGLKPLLRTQLVPRAHHGLRHAIREASPRLGWAHVWAPTIQYSGAMTGKA